MKVIKRSQTPGGFSQPPRGWNSFGMQINPAINPDFEFDQSNVIRQADALLANTPDSQIQTGLYYISLDSGWSIGDYGDEYGRIAYESSKFDIPALAKYLHSRNLKLGVYVLPGAFCKDSDKIILGTKIPISATLSGNNNGFARCDFDFSKDGVQQWHNSVVSLFAEWEVDMIKLDYITPGSPDNGGHLPPDNSGSVVAYRAAIESCSRPMRLNISWKLDRSREWMHVWNAKADSIRTDQDINNSGETRFISWATAQRAIDNYRSFITAALEELDADTELAMFPDMDSLYVGNSEDITGVPDVMRQSLVTHWVGAGANAIVGSDLTRLDEFGLQLLSQTEIWREVAAFTAEYPMQPRKPNSPRQLQAWVAGPDDRDRAFVVLANYGPDLGQGGFGTYMQGIQSVSAVWTELGLQEEYTVRDVWDNRPLGRHCEKFSMDLRPGESRLFDLQRAT